LNGVLCGYHLALIRPNQEVLTSEYLLFLFRSSFANAYFSSRAKGATRFAISLGDIRGFQFQLPTKEVQVGIGEELSLIESAANLVRIHSVHIKSTIIVFLNYCLGSKS
jgi:type I restriction enzyme, S subunit